MQIAVADLDPGIQTYDSLNPDRFVTLMFYLGTKGLKNRIHWMYNERSLTKAIQKARFRNIVKCKRHDGKCPDVEQIDYHTDVVFMEGGK